MARKPRRKKQTRARRKQPSPAQPREILMTDLEPVENPEERASQADIHAAGTPGGGTALGGLGGTVIGDGAPEDVDLEDDLGTGIHDQPGDEEPEPTGY